MNVVYLHRLPNQNLNYMSKYENGYLPKIAYHMFKQNVDKVKYFEGRQLQTYGEFTDEQRWWLLDEIHRLNSQAH